MTWKEDEKTDDYRYHFVDSFSEYDFSLYICEDRIQVDGNLSTSAHVVILRRENDEGSDRTVVGIDTNPYEAEQIALDIRESYREPGELNKAFNRIRRGRSP